jgi:hypothetical protein
MTGTDAIEAWWAREGGDLSGATRARWAALVALGRADCTLARLAEAHTDALAILAELGAPRAAGFERLLAEHPADPARLWLATTDADTVVPPGWLARQLAHAVAGWDAVAGTVEVTDWSGHAAWVQASFDAAYRVWRPVQPHPHVHGANLGVRGSAYLRDLTPPTGTAG